MYTFVKSKFNWRIKKNRYPALYLILLHMKDVYVLCFLGALQNNTLFWQIVLGIWHLSVEFLKHLEKIDMLWNTKKTTPISFLLLFFYFVQYRNFLIIQTMAQHFVTFSSFGHNRITQKSNDSSYTNTHTYTSAVTASSLTHPSGSVILIHTTFNTFSRKQGVNYTFWNISFVLTLTLKSSHVQAWRTTTCLCDGYSIWPSDTSEIVGSGIWNHRHILSACEWLCWLTICQ